MTDNNLEYDSWHDYKSTDELYVISRKLTKDISNSYGKMIRLRDKKMKAISKLDANGVTSIDIKIENIRNFILHARNILDEALDVLRNRGEEVVFDREFIEIYQEIK